MSETITINDSHLGGGGAGNLQFNVNGVTDFTNRTTDTTFSIAANQYTTDGSGEGATFDVYIDDTGAATVTLTSGGLCHSAECCADQLVQPFRIAISLR